MTSPSPSARILVVEDDENLRLALEDNLVDEGYQVTAVSQGGAALEALAQNAFDLVLLDIMLPDVDGYAVCRKIRERDQSVRVLMLTARTLEDDFVQGFDAGADDYVAKPYRLKELLARLRALLRRPAPESAKADPKHRFGAYVLDLAARSLCDARGQEIKLTRTEFDLLATLVQHRGEALSRSDLLAAAWDPEVVVEPRTVDNFVSNLKKKLRWQPEDPYRIATVRGVGYRMEIEEESS
ncbi:MAG: response regulator transcription factor [Deltaproteobacteria bacterium]|jgi:DNA-binding response OmpR family regulator|nr:response regulator transcription factor [Deltaproteobacteria bacterium]MBW2535815.1 response regulator transcription factor [Deltaproteobacteria bacterium]